MNFLNFCGIPCDKDTVHWQSQSQRDAYRDLQYSIAHKTLRNSKQNNKLRQLKHQSGKKRMSLIEHKKSRDSLKLINQLKQSVPTLTHHHKIYVAKNDNQSQHNVKAIIKRISPSVRQPIQTYSYRMIPSSQNKQYRPHTNIHLQAIPQKQNFSIGTKATYMQQSDLQKASKPSEQNKHEKKQGELMLPGLSRKTLSDFQCIRTQSVGGSEDSDAFSIVQDNQIPMTLSHLIEAPNRSPRKNLKKKAQNIQ